ncbi:hypothetical protein BKI52_05495 [marine bacterium AO1-C]|nr:hypothetical protein BKI52_05495 [marine bacterium AO1-C]
MEQQEEVIKTFYNQEKFSFKAFKKSLWASLRGEALSYVFWIHALIGLCVLFWMDDKVMFLTRYTFFLIQASIVIIPIFLLGHLYFYHSISRGYKFISFRETHLLFHPYQFTFRKAQKIDYKRIRYIQHFHNYTYVIFEHPNNEEDEAATRLVPIEFWRELAQTQQLALIIEQNTGLDEVLLFSIEKDIEDETINIEHNEFNVFLAQHPELELMETTLIENYGEHPLSEKDYAIYPEYKFNLSDDYWGYLSLVEGKVSLSLPHKKYANLVKGFAQELEADYTFIGKF